MPEPGVPPQLECWGDVDCNVFAIMSGSSTGIARKTSEFQWVSVVLPEPLAPAMMVSLGSFNGRERKLRLLFPLTLSKDFLQALSFNGHTSASSFGHLLREFDPVHCHGYRILQRGCWPKC